MESGLKAVFCALVFEGGGGGDGDENGVLVCVFVCSCVYVCSLRCCLCKDEKNVPNNDVMQDLFLPLDNEEKTLIFSLSENH